ncbi:MAG: penicillin-binding protein 2, partial [Alphaproteobacteria bacterium]|nr:penicillin-binding protein 2 [Alphaproteobacteria bacterium]
LLSKINFELPERGQPLLPHEWNEHANATIGYGYGLSPTMLHVVTAVNAIVNDGLFINPTILKRDENSLLKSYQVVSPETSEAMRKLMRLVVTNGTGYMANLHDILVGGKTGTSYKLINGKYDNNKTRTFFLSIFPTNSPKYTMLVMLDEANNNGCNSAACTTVPVSAKIIEDISPILNLDLKISKK